jgi:hypothetical protein
MGERLGVDKLLSLACEQYRDHIVREQAVNVGHDDKPVELLGRYIASEINDLYDPASSDEANVRRVVFALDNGAATLKQVANALRKHPGS